MSTVSSAPIDLGDISLIEIPYTIGGVQYVLREASGEAACSYRNAVFRATELGPDGKPSKIGNMADVEPLLVSLCLFNDQGRRLNSNELKKWPNRIVKTLFQKVKEISELEEQPEEREQLEDIMNRPGSPCTFRDLQKHIQLFKGDDYSAIRGWIGEPAEEMAKNEQSGMQDGSD